MFGLKSLFQSLARLTSAVTRSAELFEAANLHLEQQLGFDSPPALPAPDADDEPRRNGRTRSKATA